MLLHSQDQGFWMAYVDGQTQHQGYDEGRHWNVEDDTCVLYPSSALEDRLHLFFTCNFSQRVWNYLGINWVQGPNLSTCHLAVSPMRGFCFPFFNERIFTAGWNIWIIRNA